MPAMMAWYVWKAPNVETVGKFSSGPRRVVLVLLLKTKQTISLSMATSSDFRVSKENREARQLGFGFGASLRWL
jgi:hypothetical protein